MFLLSLPLGRDSAHHSTITGLITHLTVASLTAGTVLLMAGLMLNPLHFHNQRLLNSN